MGLDGELSTAASFDPGDDSCFEAGVLVWTGDGSKFGKCSGVLIAEDTLLPGVLRDEEGEGSGLRFSVVS